jgi:hypothetical protein
MNLNQLNTIELIDTYSEIIKLLKIRGVIRTKNLLGDLGEYLSIEHFNKTSKLSNLQAAPAGTQNTDAISRNGERYSIKSTTGNLTGVFYGLENPNSDIIDKQKFEYVLIVKFGDNYELEKIIQLDWDLFIKYKRWHKTMNAWNITITKALLEEAIVLFQNETIKKYNVDKIRETHEKAYEKWSVEEDENLEKMFCEGKSVKDLSNFFGRNVGAINSRIKKLELKEKYGNH